MKYAFILGQNPTLSTLEIKRTLEKFNTQAEIEEKIDNVLIVSAQDVDPNNLMERLGGTIKIIKIFSMSVQGNLVAENIASKIIGENLNDKKIIFGISQYGITQKNLSRKLSREIKRKLFQNGRSARFVLPKEFELTSVQVSKHKIKEFCIIKFAQIIYLGETVAVSDFENWNKRDYGRPFSDPKSGMIPLKLARMLINTAPLDLDWKILDPFCGSGTIINELAYLGYKNIFACDKDEEAITKAKGNFAWLVKNYPNRADQRTAFKTASAENLVREFAENFFDAIITEGFLGPALREIPSQNFVSQAFEELEKLYLKIFPTFKKILKHGGTLIFVMPIFVGEQKDFYFPALGLIFREGFTVKKDIIDFVKKISPENLSHRDTFIYGRKSQKVKREIFFLQSV